MIRRIETGGNGNAPWSAVLVSLMVVVIGNGCAANREIAQLEQLGSIRGIISTEKPSPQSLIVALYVNEESGRRLYDYQVKDGAGPYQFLVEPGQFQVVAFRDTDGSFSYQPGEPVGRYGASTPITVHGAENVVGRDLSIPGTGSVTLPFDIDLSDPAVFQALDHKANIGRVVDLNDERFSEARAAEGIWHPFTFVDSTGAGVFFLEEYDTAKIPVLFIHGIGGSPRGWQPIVERLDRSRFQPWFFHYPSAVRLAMLAWYLDESARELRARYGFERLFVVAHSMGGLVGREFVKRNAVGNLHEYVRLFVSISTPWNGAPLAGLGVHLSPTVVPSWNDMAPDSEFLANLFETRLPAYVENHLLFSYGGDDINPAAKDDGVVLLTSQLRPDAQREATGQYGFDAEHTEILSNAAVFRRINDILRNAHERPYKQAGGRYASSRRQPGNGSTMVAGQE